MKKLLSILAAVSMTATASAAVVACTADFSSITITTDENGDANFDAKVYLAKGQQISEEKDFYKLTNPAFDLIKSNDNLPNGSKQTSGVTNLTVTIQKKFFNGETNAIKDGKLTKDLKMVANFKFHVDADSSTKSELFMLVSLKDGKVDKNWEKVKVNISGTGAQPAFISATYDGKTTVTVNTKDLTKLEDKFDASKLTYGEGMDVDKAELNGAGTLLTITLKEPLKQYKTDKTYTITYTDEKLKAPLSASFQTKAVTLSDTATLAEGGKSITISGTNLGKNSDVKDAISSTGTPALDIASASTADNLLTINLNTAIVKDFKDHNWTITYKLNSGDTLDSKFSLAAKGEPTFSSAKYDLNSKTITITGTDFDNFPEGYKLDATKFSFDGGTTVKGSEASINGTSISLVLDKPIEQYSSQKQYAVGYKDADKGIDIKSTNFNVEATTLDGTAEYAGTTVTVTGHNLGNLGDVTSSVTIDGSASMKSASIAGDTLTITLNNAIDWTYEQQTFKINYTLTGKDKLTSSFNVAGKTRPSFTDAKYDRDAKTITISGSNFENFKDFDKSKFSIDPKAGVTITDAKNNNSNIVVTLDKEINETKEQGSYSIKYVDDKLGLTTNATVTVAATSLQAKASYTPSTKTIEVSGTNLGTHDDVKSSVDVLIGKTKLDVASANTIDNKLTIVLSKDIDKSYSDQTANIVYTLNSADKLDNASFTVDKVIAPTFGTASYDGDKTIAINTTNIANMIGGFDSKNLKINNDTAKEAISFASAAVDGESIKVTLNDRLKDYTTNQNYSISYGDNVLPKALTSSFHTDGLNISKTATYDQNKTITITGTKLGIDRDVTKEVGITSSRTDLKETPTIASANVKAGNLVVVLNKTIGEINPGATFTVTWNLTGGEKLDSSFGVPASEFNQNADYTKGTTLISIAGSNLGNKTVDPTSLKISCEVTL